MVLPPVVVELRPIKQGLKLGHKHILNLNYEWGSASSCCSRESTGIGFSRCSIDSASFFTYRFLPTYVVMRLLNVLEALVPNPGRLLVPQTNLQ
ncbi:hypothetical protein HAX54_031128, partial [Datura stramonium]|nr:hypothetical protein [Datura stramonium]